jgi:hypothetical protein
VHAGKQHKGGARKIKEKETRGKGISDFFFFSVFRGEKKGL